MNVPAFQGIKLWLHNFRREAPEIFGVQGLQICVVLVPLVPPRRRSYDARRYVVMFQFLQKKLAKIHGDNF